MQISTAMARLALCVIMVLLAGAAQAASVKEKIKAADILLERGFTSHAIYNLVPYYGWRENRKFMRHLARRAGVPENKLGEQDHLPVQGMDTPHYDVESGLEMDYDKPLQLARSISLCYRNGNPRRDCKLRYHQLEGCYMRERYRKACKTIGGIKSRYPKPDTDGFHMECWIVPKGDLPMLPAKAVKSKIDLTKARRNDAAPKVAKTPTTTGNHLKRAVCTSPVFQTETRKFIGPVVTRDYSTSAEYTPRRPLPWCVRMLEYATKADGDVYQRVKTLCGRDMARSFCEDHYYKDVVSFKKQTGLSQTEFGWHTACTANCDGFASIVCSKPEYIITGKYSEQASVAIRNQEAAVPSLGDFFLIDSYDVAGVALASLKGVKTVSACLEQCEQKAGCVAFSHDKWNRWCFLKSSVGSARLEPKSVSGVLREIGTPAGSQLDFKIRNYRGKNFPYEPYMTRKEKTFDACKQQCSYLLRCVAFSFEKATKSCRFLDSVGEYFTKAGFDSGAKRQVTK